MLSLPSSVRIYLATSPTDMRKGFYSLSSMVRKFGLDVYSGHLFVFISRGRNKAKILTWEKGGFVLYYKSLEQGRFHFPRFADEDETVTLEPAQLSMLLDGVDYSRVKRPRRWSPSKKG